jgi:hypothetical protein
MDPVTPTATPETTPALVIANLNDLAGAVSTASASTEKPARMYTKEGFKGLAPLATISNERLAVMAASCLRQIALNGEPSAAVLLGTDKKPGVIAQFGPYIQREAAEERKIDSYILVAADLGITREAGESASTFIQRVQQGLSAKQAK